MEGVSKLLRKTLHHDHVLQPVAFMQKAILGEGRAAVADPDSPARQAAKKQGYRPRQRASRLPPTSRCLGLLRVSDSDVSQARKLEFDAAISCACGRLPAATMDSSSGSAQQLEQEYPSFRRSTSRAGYHAFQHTPLSLTSNAKIR